MVRQLQLLLQLHNLRTNNAVSKRHLKFVMERLQNFLASTSPAAGCSVLVHACVTVALTCCIRRSAAKSSGFIVLTTGVVLMLWHRKANWSVAKHSS